MKRQRSVSLESSSSSLSSSSESVSITSSAPSLSTDSNSEPTCSHHSLTLDDSSDSSTHLPPDPLLVSAYDQLMSNLLLIQPQGDISSTDTSTKNTSNPHLDQGSTLILTPTSAPTPVVDCEKEENGEKIMTKAEKQNAKKKRRKERARAEAALVAAAKARAKGEVLPTSKGGIDDQRRNGIENEIDIVVPFRLFSSTPIKDVSLSLKEEYPVTYNPRTIPHSTVVQNRIHTLASEAAVDSTTWGYTSLLSPSSSSSSFTVKCRDLHRKVYSSSTTYIPTIRINSTNPIPPLFVAYHHLLKPCKARTDLESDVDSKSLSTTVKVIGRVLAVPIIPATPCLENHFQSSSVLLKKDVFIPTRSQTAKAKRRRKQREIRKKIRSRIQDREGRLPDSKSLETITIKARPNIEIQGRDEKKKCKKKQRLQARFYANPQGLGGKSCGYGLGYRDSAPGRREEGRYQGYVRSKDR